MSAFAAAALEREFELSDADFERLRALIHSHAGIALGKSKRELLYGRLGRRLRARGLRSFADYIALLESGDAEEWEQFTNALTTNLTSFFREPHHFDVLREHLARRRTRRALLWCAACSTGEEAYSIAIAAAEAFGHLSPPVRVLATDVATSVLEKAERGIYEASSLEQVNPALRSYFQRGTGANAGKVRVRPEIRDLVLFRQLNLQEAQWPLRGPLDAIFCRNVLMYFDRPTQRALLERFAPLLAPDGLLFVGHAESLHQATDLYRPRGKTVYALARPSLSRYADLAR